MQRVHRVHRHFRRKQPALHKAYHYTFFDFTIIISACQAFRNLPAAVVYCSPDVHVKLAYLHLDVNEFTFIGLCSDIHYYGFAFVVIGDGEGVFIGDVYYRVILALKHQIQKCYKSCFALRGISAVYCFKDDVTGKRFSVYFSHISAPISLLVNYGFSLWKHFTFSLLGCQHIFGIFCYKWNEIGEM